uniref:Uncharacterized protein n=1 Tax=Apteryx owenii TaxID=8824 RepID=A0A8B9NTM4_APTOW
MGRRRWTGGFRSSLPLWSHTALALRKVLRENSLKTSKSHGRWELQRILLLIFCEYNNSEGEGLFSQPKLDLPGNVLPITLMSISMQKLKGYILGYT